MARMLGRARRRWAGEDAAMTAEYVLMAMLVAVACLVAVTAFGSTISGLFQGVFSGLN